MSDEEVVQFSKDQRLPEPGEPVCVICGKYGEYICDETNADVCSLECKEIELKRKQNEIKDEIIASCDDITFYNWRVAAYYKYVTWGSYFTNKDIIEIRHGLHITVHGDFYHSCNDCHHAFFSLVLSYDYLALPSQMRTNLTNMGVLTPTPIQMESIPCILSNRNAILQSNTGSGKTIAYLLPFLLLQIDYYEQFHNFTDFIVLVLVPNRELAIQIEEVVKSICLNVVGVRTALLIGGESRDQQLYRLHQNSNFFIATPGRFIDLLQTNPSFIGSLLKNVRGIVLDEADSLLKSDFQEQIFQILSNCSSQCIQKVIVTATQTKNMKEQVSLLMNEAIEVIVKDIEQLNSNLNYSFYWCEENQKKKKLISLLQSKHDHILHFPLVILCQTRLECLDVQSIFHSSFSTISYSLLTVETPFQERRTIFTQFQQGQLSVLISTPGIIGRGIELQAANSMIIWSCGTSVSELIHNVGRLGRTGKEGDVIIFCNAHNKKIFPGLIRLCEENHIHLPKQIFDQLRDDEYRNTLPTRQNIKRLYLFNENSTKEWKRFQSKSYICFQTNTIKYILH